jgi:dTDP-4-amino-4,6-dideoxygalactose transaminase
MLTLFKNLGYKIEHYPVAFNNYEREISLPIYPQLTKEQLVRICNTVEEAFYSA